MKKILLLLLVLSCGFADAQTPESTIEIKAEEWFKQAYVETTFKDPYSYRLMGIKAIPITIKQGLEMQLASVLNSIKECSIDTSERNQEGHDSYMEMYEDEMAKAKKEQEIIDSGKGTEYTIRRKDVYVKYANIAIERAKSIALYLLDVSGKERIEGIISDLSEDQSGSIGYYDIRLDCYSKNSLGNEVLGRFSFPFTEGGAPLYGDDTTQYIVNLND